MTLTKADFIQVRTTGQKAGHKRIYTKGYASTKGIFDRYAFMKRPDGSTKSFRSLFTDKCIESMKRQMNAKTVFADAVHDTASDINILKLLENKNADDKEIEFAKEMLKMKKLPLAKVIGFDVDDDGFVIETETNPHFAEVDSEHAKYYDAVTNSLLEGFIKGYSINFDTIDSQTTTTTDAEGNDWTQYDDVNMYGISYANPALETNLLTEVAVRTMMQIRSSKGDNKMGNEGNEEKKPVEPTAPVTPPVEPTKPEANSDIDAIIEKRVTEALAAKEKEAEIVKAAKTQAETIADLKKEMEELRKAQGGQPKSIVRQEDKYGQPTEGNGDSVSEEHKQKFREKLNEIKSPHALYMEDIQKGIDPALARGQILGGFGEMVQLQYDAQTHLLRKPYESDIEYKSRITGLTTGTADMSLKRTRQI